jgi:hypothetical protein
MEDRKMVAEKLTRSPVNENIQKGTTSLPDEEDSCVVRAQRKR